MLKFDVNRLNALIDDKKARDDLARRIVERENETELANLEDTIKNMADRIDALLNIKKHADYANIKIEISDYARIGRIALDREREYKSGLGWHLVQYINNYPCGLDAVFFKQHAQIIFVGNLSQEKKIKLLDAFIKNFEEFESKFYAEVERKCGE